MSDIEIVKLMPEQWQRYRDLRIEALHEEPQAFGTTYADMQQRPPDFWQKRLADAILGETSSLLFAQDGEQLVGMIGAFFGVTSETADIISVYVSRARRGQGIGKTLMEAILAEIGKNHNIHKAVLGVNSEQTAAVELYRRFGFQVAGDMDEMQGDGQIHRGYVMEKLLG